MGRRKIEIQPITHERNRSVTFLKRKNGLFKKAYELGVLCSVDVVVIIFDEKPSQPGTQKLYEYSSSKVKDIIRKHSKYTGDRDSKGPGDFSRGGGKGGGGKVDEDSDAEGDEDNEEDEEEEEPPEPPKKRQRKSAATTSTKATASVSAKHASQASTSHKRERSPAPTTPQSRATTPDLRPPELPAVPSGYLQHQSQNHAAQYHHPHSNLANSSFDTYHPQTQYHQHTQYEPQLPFQNRPLQQTHYPPSYGGKYQHQNQMYGPSYRHLFDNQNPNPHNSSSFNDLLSIFEAMPSNANNPHSNGLSLPVGGGMENMHAAWPENPGLYQQQQRSGGGGGGVGGPNNWLDYLSGSGNQGRRPAVGEELIGVFQGAPARRGQTSTPDEDVDEADGEGRRSGSTSDSEYEPHREFSSSRRKGRGKKG